jgi:hypothetical protein
MAASGAATDKQRHAGSGFEINPGQRVVWTDRQADAGRHQMNPSAQAAATTGRGRLVPDAKAKRSDSLDAIAVVDRLETRAERHEINSTR